MASIIVFLLCSILVLIPSGQGQTYDQASDLVTSLMEKYDKRVRPVNDQSHPMWVNVTLDLITVQDFDEVKEKFSVVALLYIKWMDQKLVWYPPFYGGIVSQWFTAKDIWYPILVLSNPYGGLKDVGFDWLKYECMQVGLPSSYRVMFLKLHAVSTLLIIHSILRPATCFVPWGVGVDEILLHSDNPNILQTYFSENGEWTVDEMSAADSLSQYSNTLVYTIKLKRKSLFLVINIILPIVFMACISVFVFLLPPESGERVSYAVTVLLALAVFFSLVADNLPKTSKPMSHLSYFLMITLVYATLMSIIAILNLRLYHRKNQNQVPRWIAVFTRIVTLKICKRRSLPKNIVEPIDITEKGAVKSKKNSVAVNKNVTTDVVNDDDPITWQDVSFAIDTVCFITFSIAVISTCISYLVILTTGKNAKDII